MCKGIFKYHIRKLLLMKRLQLITLATAAVLISFFSAVPALAQTSSVDIPLPCNFVTPEKTFVLEATSPNDNSKTPLIEVKPGDEIVVHGYAKVVVPTDVGSLLKKLPFHLPVSGLTMFPPVPVPVKPMLTLSQNGKTITSATSLYVLQPMLIAPGKTLSINESRSIVVPKDLKPGNYELTAHVEMAVPQIIPGQADTYGATKTWIIHVLPSKDPKDDDDHNDHGDHGDHGHHDHDDDHMSHYPRTHKSHDRHCGESED